MKIYNKGKRQIEYAKDKFIKPDEIVDLEKPLAEKLIKLFGGEIIDLADKEVSSDEVLKQENEALKKEIEELKKKLPKPKTENKKESE